MSAADKRLAELLERWLASLQLHAQYLALDDQAYARVQHWPPHQRPTRWVVDLARSRLEELRKILAARQASGDDGLAEALELMAFLTTLLGSEHVERFIPLATGKADTAASATVQKPKLRAVPETKPRAPRSSQSADKSASRRTGAVANSAAEPPAAGASAMAADAEQVPLDDVAKTVIADAVRFLGWGREWPQLAGLITRLADRPAEADIWKILRAHRETIEAQARAGRE